MDRLYLFLRTASYKLVSVTVFIARVSTLRSGRSVLVTPPPHRAPFTYGASPMVSPWLVALPAVHSSCASASAASAPLAASADTFSSAAAALSAAARSAAAASASAAAHAPADFFAAAASAAARAAAAPAAAPQQLSPRRCERALGRLLSRARPLAQLSSAACRAAAASGYTRLGAPSPRLSCSRRSALDRLWLRLGALLPLGSRHSSRISRSAAAAVAQTPRARARPLAEPRSTACPAALGRLPSRSSLRLRALARRHLGSFEPARTRSPAHDRRRRGTSRRPCPPRPPSRL